jgi:hypothetical protein
MSDWDKDNPGFDMFKHLHDISRNNLTYLSGVFPPLASSLAEWNLEMLRFSTRRAMEYRELSERLSRCRTPNEMWAEQLRFFEQLQSEYSAEMGRLLSLLNGVAQNAAQDAAQNAADPLGEAARAAQAAADTMAEQARQTMAAATDMAAKTMAAAAAAQEAARTTAASAPQPENWPASEPSAKAADPASTHYAPMGGTDDGEAPEDYGDPEASMVSEPSLGEDDEAGDAGADGTYGAFGAVVSEDVMTDDSEAEEPDTDISDGDDQEATTPPSDDDAPVTDRN